MMNAETERLFSVIGEYKDRVIFSGCCVCDCLWISPHFEVRGVQPLEFWRLCETLVAYNNQVVRANSSELRARGLKNVSHTYCPYCMLHETEYPQLAKKKFPCFGNPKDGLCTNYACRHRIICMPEAFPNQEKFFTPLLHKLIVEARAATM